MPRMKLSADRKKELKDMVAQIGEDGKPKFRAKELAYQFGITSGLVSEIRHGKKYQKI